MTAVPVEPTVGRREQNRISQTQRFLDAALSIVNAEGLHGLTMGRLATDVGAAIGAVYRYFPSKGALVAEMQRSAIDRIAASYRDCSTRYEEFLDRQALDERTLGIARLVLVGEFYCDAAVNFTEELRLLQLLMAEWSTVVPVEEGFRVLPNAMALLGAIGEPIEAATQDSALLPGSTLDRVIVLTASVGAVLQVSRLDVYDQELFDGQRLARRLCADLFAGWGASAERLEVAAGLVGEFAATNRLCSRDVVPMEGVPNP